ncbi:unnamed protein product [Rotaria sp. Silwood1]|nr:unnamed protein product [Rotaria sp. Silwood1]CAF1475700.1 unnamed protein product [Rotaria sp. Silwood1]CAF1671956.1 unnamed protein product [Rotaria sp. Silwood1]CAF1672282.1 unnamed protein product [Rotaria sp. Silwood1]CAF3644666.1 unnamed protein product [Rotaria sp. Silwood1]
METIKGKPIFEHQGYLYIFNKESSNKVIWCCRNYRHNNCRGRLHTINDQVVQTVGEHNHEPNHSSGEIIEARTKMTYAAKQTVNTTHDIVADGVSKLSDHAVASLPNLKNIKRTVRRIRQKHQNPFPLPTNRDSLVIDPLFMKTNRNRTFLQFDSGPIDQRMLIFTTKKQLKILENGNYIYLDGTFDVVPELYFQLYTIHVKYLDHILPAVYILLPGKKQRLYKAMLQEIKNLVPNFDPPNVMIDFERASMNAIKSLFPTSNLNGCFFHLCQNIYRAVIRFGLKTLYSENEDFAQQIRCLPALAFLPITDVIPTFEQIKSQFPAEGEPVLTYFEENYIGVKTRLSRPRKAPKFDIELWNVNTNTLHGQHRTNNVVEGWNNRFSSLLNCSHPNFWKFLKGLKKEQSYVDAQIIQAETGARQARKREQIRREAHILNLLNEPTTTNFEKVRGLAQNISLKNS